MDINKDKPNISKAIEDIIKKLIEQKNENNGLGLNTPSGGNQHTPLLDAISTQNKSLCKFLCEHKADLTVKNGRKNHTAISYASDTISQIFKTRDIPRIKSAADIYHFLTKAAVAQSKLDAKFDLTKAMGPIVLSSLENEEDLQSVLENKADVNAVNSNGENALFILMHNCSKYSEDQVKLLLNLLFVAGIDHEYKCNKPSTMSFNFTAEEYARSMNWSKPITLFAASLRRGIDNIPYQRRKKEILEATLKIILPNELTRIVKDYSLDYFEERPAIMPMARNRLAGMS